MKFDGWISKIIANWENHRDRELIKQNLKAMLEDEEAVGIKIVSLRSKIHKNELIPYVIE
jgi:hypothetical protein